MVFAALLACALALIAGCAESSVPVSLGPPVRDYDPDDYDAVLDLWTRTDNVILLKSLDNTLEVHATFMSPDFARAYVIRRAKVYELSAEQTAALAKELQEQHDTTYSFFVSATTPQESWNDLDKDSAIWNIALINDAGAQVGPAEVDRERKISVATRTFFPYVGSFSRVYMLRFPKVLPDGQPLVSPTTSRLTLRFAGPLGQAELVWRLR